MRDRHSRSFKEFPADLFGQERMILDRIVEGDFVIAMESLAGGVLFEIQGQSWIIVDWAKTARGPFEVEFHIGINDAALANDRFYFWPFLAVAPTAIPQGGDAGIGDQDADPQNVSAGKDIVVEC